MEFTNVLPGVKLVKQDEDGNEEELFVSQNDHVIVKTLNGRERSEEHTSELQSPS